MQVLNYLHSGSLKANRSKSPTPSFPCMPLLSQDLLPTICNSLYLAALYKTGLDYAVSILKGGKKNPHTHTNRIELKIERCLLVCLSVFWILNKV